MVYEKIYFEAYMNKIPMHNFISNEIELIYIGIFLVDLCP